MLCFVGFRSDFLAFKAVPSTDLGASSVRVQPSSIAHIVAQLAGGDPAVRAQGVSASGKYTIWRDSTASRIGTQADPVQGIPLNYDSCFLACNDDSE
jgi:hypothetical protein